MNLLRICSKIQTKAIAFFETIEAFRAKDLQDEK
jgi:hypothetical protein